MANIVRTICSGCMEPVKVDIDNGVATMQVPSNGRRGSLHVPAHEVTADVMIDSDDTLAMWECPRCDYSDSVYATAALRRELS